MADTFTPHYNLTKPQVGGDPDTWGNLLNNNFDTIDTVLFGKLDTTGGTISGALTVSGDLTQTGNHNLNAAAGVERWIMWRRNGVIRWRLGMNSSSESGGNAGSPLYLQSFTDSGSLNANVLVLDRQSNVFAVGIPVQISGALKASPTGATPSNPSTFGLYTTGQFGGGLYLEDPTGGTSGSWGLYTNAGTLTASVGAPGGGTLLSMLTLTNTGTLAVRENLVVSGGTISGGNGVILGGSNAGAVALRPNGTGSTTGQMVIGTDGNATVAGSLIAANSLVSNAGIVAGAAGITVGGSSAGSVVLRPNGTGSGTGQAVLGTNGNLSVGGTVITNAGVVQGTTGIIVGGASAGAVVLRPNGTGSTTGQATLGTNGVFTATDFQATSDRRLKSDICPLRDGLPRLKRMLPRKYLKYATAAHTGIGRPEAGFIAQEVQEVLPSAVEARPDGYLSVSPGQVLALVASAVLELSERIDQMEAAHGRAE